MILLTASGRAPLDPYFTLLKPRGKLVSVSLTDAPCALHPAPCTLHPARLRCAHQVSLPDKEERSQLYLHSAVRPERHACTMRSTLRARALLALRTPACLAHPRLRC